MCGIVGGNSDGLGEMDTKKIIVFGAGMMGEKFVYQHHNEIAIHCFWDNNKTGECLGFPVRKPEFHKNCFIIVAAAAYLEMRRQLIHMGYQEFEDFIPSQLYKKKMAVAYGNCHIGIIKRYLECSREFTLEYDFYPFPLIQEIKDMDIEYQDILQYCDLFLHQSVRKDNVYGENYSSGKMLQYVGKSCRIISVPNLYGMPKYLFPQIDRGHDWYKGSFRPFQIDSNVVLWLRNGKSREDIMNDIYVRGGVYEKTEILNMWDNFKVKLQEREQEWDIKISDYILKNYKREKLFCDLNHITGRLAKEIASRILEYMGYKKDISVDLLGMDSREIPVYKDVKDALGLEFEDAIIRKYTVGFMSINNREMDLEEYIEQLCSVTEFYLKQEDLEI